MEIDRGGFPTMPVPIDTLDPTMTAYFSMEIGLDQAMPTYSGGLGILAGDTLRAAADLKAPMVGVTLLHRRGYLKQFLDEGGNQSEAPADWYPEEHLQALPQRVTVHIEGRPVLVRAWQYVIPGVDGGAVPVYFLDTDLRENHPEDRSLTDHLYGGDTRYRLCQEVVLGLGGLAMLRTLGYQSIDTFHMNEGHCSLLTLGLVLEQLDGRNLARPSRWMLEQARENCVFTTHTPVPAGHDEFPMDLVQRVMGHELTELLLSTGWSQDTHLNLTHLALNCSRFVNGVSRRHAQVSQAMYPDRPIAAVTNGVHAATWVAPAFHRLYERHLPDWRRDNQLLRQAGDIPLAEVDQAHREAKAGLLEEVARRSGWRLDPNVFTIGFARRAAAYKRADLLFHDLERLKALIERSGPVQVLYAGKAHAQDQHSKEIIRRVFGSARALRDTMPVIYLADYDMDLGRLLCSGVDLWLNTPQRPMEASGTSGMKAALNGVPSLSILDGWWEEGHVEGVTGWSIDSAEEGHSDRAREADSLYAKLEQVVLPMYYQRPDEFSRVRRSAIAINGAYFNTHRMLTEYLEQGHRNRTGSPVPDSVLCR